ncbi:OpgC domain-containing protein [Bradyrhizobium icense]|uniref:OpgC domain-containing protein n=1 Tax=Bradyrhizobium icense TaxID=1274631 RepID=A0A1B1UDP9_9BRAD|nr:OpgC domain-containing protein [Bradyrhizobium icense]ANW00889.1 hypothetical protein LMTR13_12610 [Bradyrhizobium icense]
MESPLQNYRDLRLDLLRGAALWAIFLDHIPQNVMQWITIRNYGFSDAADLFVFISGYTTSFVYARIMLHRGFVVGATRLFKRVGQLYSAHIILFVIYVAAIGFIARRFHTFGLIHEFNIAGLVTSPIQALLQGLLLRFKPLNMDVLPLYIMLMAFFPPILWLMLRKPSLTMLGSLLLYLAARHFGWNLSAYPTGGWYFNPFAWQLLFVFGSWCALGGTNEFRYLGKSQVLPHLAVAYLFFALLMTMAGRFPNFGYLFPGWLVDYFNPNDKTNLAPYRFVHFVALAYLVVRLMSRDWSGLQWRIFSPVIKCGQQSLAVFCVGIFLSFVAHFVLVLSSGSVLAQIIVSLVGIVIMTAVAYYVSWSKTQDKVPTSSFAPARARFRRSSAKPVSRAP